MYFVPSFSTFTSNLTLTTIMDASEYQTILGYLQTQEIPSEIKNDRYKKKNFIRKQGDLRSRRKTDESNNCSNYFQIVSNQYFILEPEEEEWNIEIPRDSN